MVTFVLKLKYKFIMSKITAKHFLNTNLKPYLINSEKHYSVYIALVAYRKNTKVKSITFDEYYNENTFNEIVNSVDEYDINLIKNEIDTLSLITEISVKILKEFDTAFVTSYFKFSSMINIDSNLEFDKYLRERQINWIHSRFDEESKFANYNKIVQTKEIEREDFEIKFDLMRSPKSPVSQTKEISISFFDYIINHFGSITIFDFYNNINQAEFLRLVKKFINQETDIEFIFEYNKALFLNSLNRFSNYIKNTKNEYLIEKYKKIFENAYLNKYL